MKKDTKVIANQFEQSDKNIWMRKYNAMQELVNKANALADQILDLEELKTPIIDEITTIRNIMIQECIHPSEHLVEYPDCIICKFCDRKFVVN